MGSPHRPYSSTKVCCDICASCSRRSSSNLGCMHCLNSPNLSSISAPWPDPRLDLYLFSPLLSSLLSPLLLSEGCLRSIFYSGNFFYRISILFCAVLRWSGSCSKILWLKNLTHPIVGGDITPSRANNPTFLFFEDVELLILYLENPE